MSRTKAGDFERWYDYEKDAHAKTIGSMESVPADRRGCAEFQKAVSILAHLAGARRMWLGRLGVLPPMAGPLFPLSPSFDQAVSAIREVETHWTNHLASLDDADLERHFEYQSIDAGRFRNRIGDVLTQLFGHSWYHRGQIAMLVRAAGGEPAITDLIFWCREPL